jgi:pyruvate/2-oxoglutarate dehydrogenase complex dihydrolipoamide dehydrogenase (E3) component
MMAYRWARRLHSAVRRWIIGPMRNDATAEPSRPGLSPLTADLAVVGFGKGGKTLAATLARAGRRVVLIEQSDQMYGGTCINIGCVPTKALVYQAEHPDPHLDSGDRFTRAATQTAALTAAMRATNFAMLDSLDTATVVTGRATFTGPHTLLVTAGEDRLEVTAETIVINTGADPVLPPVPGLATSAYVVTSTGLLARTARPRHLVVLGGGYVGVELASMHAAFGAEVTLIQRGDRVLRSEDPEISAEVEALLTDAGVRILSRSTVRDVADSDGEAVVTYQSADGSLAAVGADVVLAALGRRPHTDGLGLAEAGIAVDARGAVVVDEHLRTSVPHVFAVGDVNGGPQHTYVSLDDFRIVLSQLAGDGRRSTRDRVAVPHTVFTTPPLARVGLTEAQARATGRAVRVARRRVADMATVPRARIVGEARGVMTAVVDAETDAVLGVAILAHDAQEVINTVALAMRHGVTASELRDGIYTHPSMTEALNDLFGNLSGATAVAPTIVPA